MRYGAFTKNRRIVFAEDRIDFFNNLEIYLYFSQTARFLTIAYFEAENIPDDIYNYQIVDNRLELLESPIIDEQIHPINKLRMDLESIKNDTDRSKKLLIETFGNDNLGTYISSKYKKIAEHIINNQPLTPAEQQLFQYEKSKYDNITDIKMAEMIIAQIKLWEHRLDYSILESIKNIDKKIAGGF